jgi:D-sedoheptulose 7-phosphate isomerase
MNIRHVILDRDGVLNEMAPSGGYVTRPTDWTWIPGSLDALALLARSGIKATIATNQSAVGRQLMSRLELDTIHAQMIADAESHGASITAVLICPHAPEDRCDCRKPRPGLIRQALQHAGSEVGETVLIGDDETDVEASWAAGITAVLVRTGRGRTTETGLSEMDVPVFDDLFTATRAIVARQVSAPEASQLSVRLGFLQHLRAARTAAITVPRRLLEAADLTHQCLAAGGKLLACGNGGSAADAQHLVAELVGRYRDERPARAAIALGADSVTLTALANDYGYERSFSRQIEALARPGDVLVAISTSGRSPNVLEAVRVARSRGCKVLGLAGEGGELAALCDIVLTAPSTVVPRIQELHGLFIHIFVEELDRRLRMAAM